MRNLSFVMLVISIISVGCKAPLDVKLCYLKIAPIGISDFPLDTLYISVKKIDRIPNASSREYEGSIQQVLTDEKTMSKISSFVNENDHFKSSMNEKFDEFGCFNISLYQVDSLVTTYNLHRSDSKKYLTAMISILAKNNLDRKVIKVLKEQALSPINY